MTRKRRNDRNHVIYLLTCTSTGDTYIGITVAMKRAYKKSVNSRWMRHIYRAMVEQVDQPLARMIREMGPENFTQEVVEIVRGKTNAHIRERQLIQLHNPTLNDIGFKSQ